MKLDDLDIKAIELLRLAFKRCKFPELMGNDMLALTRAYLVLEDLLEFQKKPPEPAPLNPMPVIPPITQPAKANPKRKK